MAGDLRKYQDAVKAEAAGLFNLRALLRHLRKPQVEIPAALVVVAMAFLAFWFFNRQAKIRWAEGVALPEIKCLHEASDFRGAYELASRAEKFMPQDSRLQDILADIIDEVAIETEPPGAAIYYKNYRGMDDP
jgi:urease gamma subunit